MTTFEKQNTQHLTVCIHLSFLRENELNPKVFRPACANDTCFNNNTSIAVPLNWPLTRMTPTPYLYFQYQSCSEKFVPA